MPLLELGYPTLNRTNYFPGVLSVSSFRFVTCFQVLRLLNSTFNKSDRRFQVNNLELRQTKSGGRAFIRNPP